MFGFRNRQKFNGSVDVKLNNEYQIKTKDNPHFFGLFEYLELIDYSWNGKQTPDEAALRIATLYYCNEIKRGELRDEDKPIALRIPKIANFGVQHGLIDEAFWDKCSNLIKKTEETRSADSATSPRVPSQQAASKGIAPSTKNTSGQSSTAIHSNAINDTWHRQAVLELFKGVVITCRQYADGPYWSRVFPVGPVLSELENLDPQAKQYKEIFEVSGALSRYSVTILNKLGARDVRPISEAIETELPIATSAAMSRSGLARSKIVFVEFHSSAIVQTAKPSHEPTTQSGSTSSQQLEPARQSATTEISVDEDGIYTAIFNELENKTYDKGLWTRLFAECNGDETKTKVMYIKRRAKILVGNEIKKPISSIRQEGSHQEQESNRRALDAQKNTSERDSIFLDFQDRGWKISHDGIKWTFSKGQLSHNAWTAEDIKRFWLSNKRN